MMRRKTVARQIQTMILNIADHADIDVTPRLVVRLDARRESALSYDAMWDCSIVMGGTCPRLKLSPMVAKSTPGAIRKTAARVASAATKERRVETESAARLTTNERRRLSAIS